MLRFDNGKKSDQFLLDVQNYCIDLLQSRIVIPLRLATPFGPTMRDLNPVFTISGQKVVLDTGFVAEYWLRIRVRRI
jgi:hypothetical protein